jgi:hypothetical protein
MYFRLFGLFVIIAVNSCGDDSSSGGNPSAPSPNNSRVALTSEELPNCDATTNGQLVYVSDEQLFKYCDSSDWNEIVLKGEKGDKGEDSEQINPLITYDHNTNSEYTIATGLYVGDYAVTCPPHSGGGKEWSPGIPYEAPPRIAAMVLGNLINTKTYGCAWSLNEGRTNKAYLVGLGRPDSDFPYYCETSDSTTGKSFIYPAFCYRSCNEDNDCIVK